jgi:two-component system response regulator AtoC
VDVRVVAATARDLEAAVEAGDFREDLFYRLNVVAIRLPPLRERPEDVEELARHFLARRAKLRAGAPLSGFSAEALDALRAHRWPGNVRELEHAVERAVVLAEGPEIREEDLPDAVREPPRAPAADPVAAAGQASSDLSLKRAMRAVEEQLVRRALEQTRGNRTRAAELLEISYRALLYKIKEHGIEL